MINPSAPVGPTGPVAPQQGAQGADPVTIMEDATKLIDSEVTQLSTKDVKGKDATRQATGKEAKAEVGRQDHVPEDVAAEMAAVLTADELEKKKRKKKTKLEEKMEELAALEGQIDLEQLPEEDQQVFEELFSNLGRMRNLKGQLKRAEDRGEQLRQQADKKKRKGNG